MWCLFHVLSGKIGWNLCFLDPKTCILIFWSLKLPQVTRKGRIINDTLSIQVGKALSTYTSNVLSERVEKKYNWGKQCL